MTKARRSADQSELQWASAARCWWPTTSADACGALPQQVALCRPSDRTANSAVRRLLQSDRRVAIGTAESRAAWRASDSVRRGLQRRGDRSIAADDVFPRKRDAVAMALRHELEAIGIDGERVGLIADRDLTT